MGQARLGLQAWASGDGNVKDGWCWVENGNIPVARVKWAPGTVLIDGATENCMAIRDAGSWMDISCNDGTAPSYYSLCEVVYGKLQESKISEHRKTVKACV